MTRKRVRPNGTHKMGRPPKCVWIHPQRVDGKITKAHYTYQTMIQRYYNPNATGYENYGGRGITVCDRWRSKDGYNNFVMDMGVPLPGFTIERKNNSLGYSPDNCCWATMKEQVKNRRPKSCIQNSLFQRAKRAGIHHDVVYQRINKLGWSEERALSTKKQIQRSHSKATANRWAFD